MVSLTFGAWDKDDVAQLHSRGIQAWATVTCLEDALTSLDAGVDALIVQSHQAGGHQASFDDCRQPQPQSLEQLCREIVRAMNEQECRHHYR